MKVREAVVPAAAGISAIDRAEKLGLGVLADVELLSIVIGNGSGRPSMAVAYDLMAQHHTLEGVAGAASTELSRVAGVGACGAARVRAAAEIGRRLARATVDERAPLRAPRDVWRFFAPLLEDKPVEEFHVAILDAQHRLAKDVTVSVGILNSSLVHPREVFVKAIRERAAAVILVHNHPSGDPTPSNDDRNVTEQLVAAGRLLDIPVQDHVIIGRGRYTSFAESGLL